ncbi:MAG TPA: acyl-CoA dehydrogenase C-terminal domain-containing protein, partial [Alicycliphilus sp.]|nr:acyl-CoA dehydrogenase C-terminal domain-containing protein [Alicycliphilus sp.]
LSSATRAYGHAAHYARERLAGRAARPEDRTGGAADPIIVHPDVRRLLLRQAAFLEGARALGLWVRVLLDDQDARRALVGSFLTPVIKAFFSDRAFDSANDAMQLMGGHGYIRDNGVEQLVRDCRIFQLYEGANGVQALDLALRKLPQGGGEALPGLLAMVDAVIAEADRHDELRSHGQALRRACEAVRAVAQWLQSPERQPCDIGAASYDFLHMVGIVAVGFMWLRMALLALDRLPAAGNAAFFQRKLELARYWFERELPLVAAYGQRAQVGAAGLMALPADQF